jgi:hypothetical protein
MQSDPIANYLALVGYDLAVSQVKRAQGEVALYLVA